MSDTMADAMLMQEPDVYGDSQGHGGSVGRGVNGATGAISMVLPLRRLLRSLWPRSCIFVCRYCGERVRVPHAEHYRVGGRDECRGEWVRYRRVE